ncbi:UDP binding domain-containing protein, partial [Porphyromonas loveana]|uniref:UDP binding domain-containing protein n=1 Tax=Porphyromonas loveana TaxID=1884669 RepID=UPI00359FB50F
VEYGTDMYDGVKGADALFHVRECKEFRMPDWTAIHKAMATPLIIDGRNVYEVPSERGFVLLNIGQ